MAKKLFIETLGCAMNVRDSEHMIAELSKEEHYELTEHSPKPILSSSIPVAYAKNL